jgi:hypothetical protein
MRRGCSLAEHLVSARRRLYLVQTMSRSPRHRQQCEPPGEEQVRPHRVAHRQRQSGLRGLAGEAPARRLGHAGRQSVDEAKVIKTIRLGLDQAQRPRCVVQQNGGRTVNTIPMDKQVGCNNGNPLTSMMIVVQGQEQRRHRLPVVRRNLSTNCRYANASMGVRRAARIAGRHPRGLRRRRPPRRRLGQRRKDRRPVLGEVSGRTWTGARRAISSPPRSSPWVSRRSRVSRE